MPDRNVAVITGTSSGIGLLTLSKAVIPVMRRQKSGHIIQVASVAGRVGNPMLSAYRSSKFALESWSDSVRMELGALFVRYRHLDPQRHYRKGLNIKGPRLMTMLTL
jgi:short-subunit dehydrogenase